MSVFETFLDVLAKTEVAEEHACLPVKFLVKRGRKKLALDNLVILNYLQLFQISCFKSKLFLAVLNAKRKNF